MTAIVVARGGSERVPNKALRPFGDSTLIGHKVDQLRQCESVDEVVVGSDSDAILEEATRHGASVRKRDAYHCDEARCSANEMIRNMAAMVDTDVVLWAHPTNPLCLPSIYDEALDAYRTRNFGNVRPPYDSLVSVRRIQRHAWQHGKPLNFNPWAKRHPLARQLDPILFQDGAIFIQRHQDMIRNAYFYGERPILYELEFPYGFDVDTEQDLLCAQALYSEFRVEVLE